MKYIIITGALLLTITGAFQLGQRSQQQETNKAQAEITEYEDKIINGEIIQVKHMINCWDEDRGSEYVEDGKLNDNYAYCLLVPNDDWDF